MRLRLPKSVPNSGTPLRVAVIGTGPAASYTAQALLTTHAKVTMIDRLPFPEGLLRYGVAPDHPATKRIGDRFSAVYRHPRVRMHLNVDVGTHVTHAEVAKHHHAVVYAVGAAADKRLGITGEDLPGSISATTFVAWYNGHPDCTFTSKDLSVERVVVVGNGNVALDVARILMSDPDQLAKTDIADHALDALRASKVREVVLLGRRGPESAAYSRSELLALNRLDGVKLVVEDNRRVREAICGAERGSKAALLQGIEIGQLDRTNPPPPERRIVFGFYTEPTEVIGDGRVTGVRTKATATSENTRDSSTELMDAQVTYAGMILRAIGHRGVPVAGLPFDPATATVSNDAGRVVDPATHRPVAGTYVVGWIKRGPSGGIGANRSCAAETVASLLQDAANGELPAPTGSRRDFGRLLRRRAPHLMNLRHISAIDRAERQRGVAVGRPRVKFATTAELLQAARPRRL